MWVHFWWYMVCGYIIHNWSVHVYIWYGFISGGLCLLSRLRPYVVCGYIIHNWSLNICTYNVGSFLVVYVYFLLSGLRPYVVCGYIIHNWSLNICTYNVASFLVVNCLLSGLRPYVVCGYIYTQLVCRYIHMMWVHFWWYMVCGYIIYNWSVDMYIWCGFISCGLCLLSIIWSEAICGLWVL